MSLESDKASLFVHPFLAALMLSLIRRVLLENLNTDSTTSQLGELEPVPSLSELLGVAGKVADFLSMMSLLEIEEAIQMISQKHSIIKSNPESFPQL